MGYYKFHFKLYFMYSIKFQSPPKLQVLDKCLESEK